MSLKNINLNNKPNILVIVGPTASGKSELAVKLAKKLNGEIISCDSRQIYKGLNLGTGKIEGQWKNKSLSKNFPTPPFFEYKNIPHFCIDYIKPTRQYSSAKFQQDAKKAIKNILSRGKLPILCGGSAHWIDAVVYNQQLPNVKPNKKLRAKLEKKSTEQLFIQLQKLDPVRAKSIDANNPHRLIRALEIVITTGMPVPPILNPKSSIFNPIWLGIKTNQTSLYKKIDKRLKERFTQKMTEEVKHLHSPNTKLTKGLSWKKLESFGLEYKFIALYLQNKINYVDMVTQLSYAIKHYSKRQLTWWKKNNAIIWTEPKVNKIIPTLKKYLNGKSN